MIIQTILATCFSILQRCCAQSLPSGFRHLQTEFAWKICIHPRGRSAAPVRKIRVVPHNYPWVPAWNNHRLPWKRLSLPCHVPYINSNCDSKGIMRLSEFGRSKRLTCMAQNGASPIRLQTYSITDCLCEDVSLNSTLV